MDLIILIAMEIVYVFLLVFYVKDIDDFSLGKWLFICLILFIITVIGNSIFIELGIVHV